MTYIYLARHGETEWNAIGRLQGHTNSVLNARGLQQAQALAARLERLPIQAIYSSDLTRAVQTIAPAARALGVTVQMTPDLREKGFGAWEGLTVPEIAAAFPEEWHSYHVLRKFDAPVPGGETWEEVQTRMARALSAARAAHPGADDTVLLVGHGGALRTLIVDTLAAPLPCLHGLHLDNCSLSLLEYREGHTPRVLLLNQTPQLEDTE